MEKNATEHDEDMSDIADRLYAEVHYAIGNESNTTNAEDTATIRQNPNENIRIVSAHSIVSKSSEDGNSKNSNRYWSSNTSTPLQRFKSKKRYETNQSNDPNRSATQKNDPIPKVPSGNKPKTFTPYKSLMSDIGIITSTPKKTIETFTTTDDLNQSQQEHNYGNSSPLKETSKLIKNGGKRKNPFASDKSTSNDKRLNPFSKNVSKQDKMSEKKRKTERNRKKADKTKSDVIYEVDSDQNDDDVIILPTPPVPMITIDSSDDDSISNGKNKSFVEPKKVNGSNSNKQQGSRCPSPTNSIMSDDFIVQTDRGRSNAFNNYVREEDLIEVNQTVDSIVRATTSNTIVDTASDVNNFTTPQESDTPKKKKNKKSKNNEPKSYQVGENSFAAVDVYESESSDMPESVYVKGIMGKRKNVSSSSSDSTVEDFNVQKSKRLKKRKSSGSQKDSDFIASSNSSESSDNDNQERTDTLPYLVRGEALGKIRKSQSKKLKQIKRTMSCSENPSDNEFISKLTSIGHEDSDDDEDGDESKENSTESIAARDIVQSVLQKRSTRLKTISETEKLNSDNETTNQIANNLGCEKDALNETNNQIDLKNADDKIISSPAEKTCDNINSDESIDDNNSEEDEDDVVAIEPQISTIDLIDEEETSDIVADNDLSENNAMSENVVLDAEHPEMGWNEEMDYFYNRSWGGENFNTKMIQSRMSKKHPLWKISRNDIVIKKTRTGSARCINCYEKGHYARDCKKKKKGRICAMCGGKGHLDTICPKSICFKCGEKTPIFKFGCSACKQKNDIKCYVCRSNGHKAIECPDKWRRYHNTIDSTIPVVCTNLPTSNRKYCSICAAQGHLAENCNKTSLVKSHGRKIHSIFVKSYRDAYKPVEEFDPNVNNGKFVFFSNSFGNHPFSYGDDVNRNGNTIYARFANKFGLKEPTRTETSKQVPSNRQSQQNSNISSRSTNNHKYFDENLSQEVNNSTMPMETSEDYSNANSERFIDSSVTESSEYSRDEPNETDDKINMIASLQNSLDLLNEIKETKQDDDRKISEINSLNYDLEKLQEMKNVFNHTDDEPLPDFIPLTSDEPEKYTETRSENDYNEEKETKSEAQILLSSAHCKYLLTATGHTFLKDHEEKCNITLRMEWKDYGNVMIVRGFHRDQLRFRKLLSTFLDKIDEIIKSRSEVQIPKNRKSLVKHIVEQFRELDTLAVEPHAYYHKMCKNAAEKTRASQKREKTFRRFLNMTLFGIYGFLDGAVHVAELQTQLRHLMLSDAVNITVAQRIKIREHLNYVFSDMVIGGYNDLIKKAKKIGKNPAKYVKLDRKLIGLPLKQQSNRTNKNLLMASTSQTANVHDTTPVSHEDITLNTTTDGNDQTI